MRTAASLVKKAGVRHNLLRGSPYSARGSPPDRTESPKLSGVAERALGILHTVHLSPAAWKVRPLFSFRRWNCRPWRASLRADATHCTGGRDPPPCTTWALKNHCGDIEQCRTPHKVSTAPQFGTPNGVLYWSMSPQLFFQARVVQGGGPRHLWYHTPYSTPQPCGQELYRTDPTQQP